MAKATTEKPKPISPEEVIERLTEKDPDTDELVAKHYQKPQTDEELALTQFDYSRLKGTKFEEYFELVEGKVRSQLSHSMAVRSGGLNRNASYVFEKYRGYPIKETANGHTKIVGIELISTRPENVGMKLPLHVAVTLNSQIGAASRQYPCDIYLLHQNQPL